jgi:VanZ family protein
MAVIAIVVSGVIGFCDEVIQIFTPNRTLDRVDYFFDILGSLSGILLYVAIKRGWGVRKDPLNPSNPIAGNKDENRHET